MKNIIRKLSEKERGLIYIIFSIVCLSILILRFKDLSLYGAYLYFTAIGIVFLIYILFKGFSKIITKYDENGNEVKKIPKKIDFVFSYILITLGIFFLIYPWVLIVSQDLGLMGLGVFVSWLLFFLPLGVILIGFNIKKILIYKKIIKESLEEIKKI